MTIELEQRIVTDNLQEDYGFDKLLLATGGSPRQLPFGGEDIIYFRSLADYRRLREQAERGSRFAVIGAGFIGSELAAALAMNGKEVSLLFPGAGICDRIFPADLSEFLNHFYEQKGVKLYPRDPAIGLERRDGHLVLKTRSNQELVVDGVVAGLGINPNLELARMIGARTQNGIVVDEYLRTTKPNVYAAGDVAEFHNPALGKFIRVEHEDNANTMGRLAGRNMAGAGEPYHHLPFFYSDLFELGYEAVGELDARLNVQADWKERFREGVLYYEEEGRVRGVLLWNVWGQVDAARQLIADKRQFQPNELKQTLLKAA
jgi:NADPH-dependent 2,4-dienoyl-CoA reductase/sulfur reductase-like enzyme